MRKVFLSLVNALDAHRDVSTQSQFFQEHHEEALSQIETVLPGEGLQLWQEFCASKEYKDEDRVTPEKLLEYVDLICLPFDNMRQDTTNRNRSYPQLVLSLQILVRPVLQLWVKRASSLNAEHTFTERTAVEEAMDNDNGDMDYQSEYKPETNQDVYNVKMDGELDDDKDGDRSDDEADGRKSVSRPKPTKKEQDSLEMLSKRAATINPVQVTSALTSLTWILGRYKAGEFKESTARRTSLAVDKMAPTIDIDTAGNIIAILEEWRFGSHETPAFQDLNKQYGHHWRKSEHYNRYHTRKTVICEFKRLVSEEGMGDDDAIALLVARQGPKATTTFVKDLGVERRAREQIAKKGKAVSQRNSSMSRAPSDPSSSSCDTTRALTSFSAFDHSTPKKTGGMKQTMLWASAGVTPNNHLTEKAPTSEARSNVLSWCQVRNTKVLQHCAPIPGVPETWDNVALDRTYRFPIFNDIATVQHLWEFWTRGWQGGPSVRAMSTEHGATWRKKTYDSTIFQWYESRYRIVQQVQKLVELGWTQDEATERLEILRSREELSLEGLAGHLDSLYNIPEAIADAKYPNPHSLVVTMAKSADASEGGSGSMPFMGYVGGRRAPSTHHLQLNTATQKPLIEEMLDPFIRRREDYAITLSQYERRIKSRMEPGEVSSTDTVEAESEYDRTEEEEVDTVEEIGIQI
ncbi:hypothetical protein BGX24_001271 [Mortierella sp. AD032]|nr:hypothetical protein BGX24_001271 [Mortierella sp. AD032]